MLRRVIAGIVLVGVGMGAGLLIRPLMTGSTTEASPGTPAQADRPPAAATPEPKIGFQVGMEAPDFTLKDLSGEEVRLSDLRGKPVFINFWASWCPPCRMEMPDMERFYRENGQEFHLLAINETASEKSPETPRAYLEEEGFTFPVLFDVEGEAAYRYGVRALPTSFFVDAKGVIRAVSPGAMDLATMKANLAKAVRGAP